MKKSLLLASALLCVGSAIADNVTAPGVDPTVYEKMTSGDKTFTLKNRWLYSNNLTGYAGTSNTKAEVAANQCAWATNNNGMRTATIYNNYVLITDNTNNGFHKLDLATGEYKGFTKYTIDGAEVTNGISTTNQIGLDDFGHIYVIGYIAPADPASGAVVKLRTLDPETGALTQVGEVDLRAEAWTGGKLRLDYYQVIGDITGVDAKAQIVSANSITSTDIVRGTLDQGATEWTGALDGYYNWEATPVLYPAKAADWGNAVASVLIKDEEFSGSLFYVDGNATAASLYDDKGQTVGTFADNAALAPNDLGTNGICEVNVAGKNFIIYSLGQYISPAFCQIRVACSGDSQEYADLVKFWDIPENGLGSQTDAGIRIHGLQTLKMTDENGKEGAYILDYKCRNGVGVYVLAEEGFKDPNPNNGVEGIENDDLNVAPVYYNIQGMQVENPENGLYIVKRGNKVTKEVIR